MEDDNEERRTIDWEKLNSILSSNTSEALKEFLGERNATTTTTTMQQKSEVDSDETILSPTSKETEDSEANSSLSRIKYGVNPPNSVFKLQDYWEERFAQEDSYEWLASWKKVRELIQPYLTFQSKILIVGCGNSSFSADIYDEGYTNITNIDFSAVVIQKMSHLHQKQRPLMKWIEMDMTNLEFPSNSFDVVLDKAAMDALVVDEGDVWAPKEEVVRAVDAMCLCVTKVLKPNGIFLQISFAQPHFRTKYLIGYRADRRDCNPYESHRGFSSRYGWQLDYRELPSVEGGCLSVFLYDMKKTDNEHEK